MSIGSTLSNAAKAGLGGLQAVGSKLKDPLTAVGKSMAQTAGVVEKAIIEIADFSGVDFEEEKAQKPGGGKKGLGFDSALVEQYAELNKISNSAVNAIKATAGAAAGGGDGFEIHAKLKRTRFEVQFNPNELNFVGYGGEQMAIQNYSDTGKNQINNVDSHIEMTIPLLFDKVDNQDAFYADKFTLGQTSVARGVTKLGIGAVNSIRGKDTSKSVQQEIEAFTAIIRSNDKRLIRFVWGDMAYEGILNGVNAEYTMFNVNGEPIRATMNLRVVLLDANKYNQTIRLWTRKYKDHLGYSKEKAAVASMGLLDVD